MTVHVRLIYRILYVGLMDWEAGNLTIRVGTGGGAFANENCPRGREFDQFFRITGVCPGGCSRLELTCTLLVKNAISRALMVTYTMYTTVSLIVTKTTVIITIIIRHK